MSDKDTGAFPQYKFDSVAEKFIADGGMTLRQYAAIKLKVPDSGTDWLDKMIEQSLLNDLESKAMQAMITRDVNDSWTFKGISTEAHSMASVMIQARKA